MNRLKLYSTVPIYSLVILTVIFCGFTIGYEKYTAQQALARLEKHALIIADDLWNFNSEGAQEYLKLAAEADHYETLEVTNHNGEMFQSVATGLPTKLERLFISLHLTPRVVLLSTVESRTNVIGWIEAVWIPQTLYVQTYVFAFLVMVLISIFLYCRILKQNYLLEQRVEERTNELTESNKILELAYQKRIQAEEEQKKLQLQLEQSRKMESIGLLAGGVAHDLNNVLSGIVSYPDLLLHDMPQDSPMRSIITTIRSSGLRAAEIIQDLLTLARRGVVTKQQLDLNTLINEYCQSPEYQKLLENYPAIKVIFIPEEPLPPIMGSATALKKVIMNLVSNGAEAPPKGGHVIIETNYRLLETSLNGFQPVTAGKYVVLTVSDEGEGITTEDLQRIFEPFYTKKVMGRSGTGLGLTVVWGTTEDHNGAIDVRSTPDIGTTFDIYLPVATETISASQETELPCGIQGKQERILVVDDLASQREIACAILQRMGYKVDAVASGEEAVAMLKEKKVELVVLDMLLDGGIDGLETYKRILDLHPEQKAIIASGFSESDQIRQTQKLGAGKCIKKPYTLEQLSVAVWQELNAEKPVAPE